MKKINVLLLLPLLFICVSTGVFAKPIQSDEEIAGNWLLKYTKKSLQENETKAMDITWALENQTLTQKDIPQVRGGSYDSAPMKYVIENGNLKVGIPGRAGKFDEYSLEEKTDTTMVLKDQKFGTLLYFIKK